MGVCGPPCPLPSWAVASAPHLLLAALQSEAAAARLGSDRGGPEGASRPSFWRCLSPPSPGGCFLLSVCPGWLLTSPGRV